MERLYPRYQSLSDKWEAGIPLSPSEKSELDGLRHECAEARREEELMRALSTLEVRLSAEGDRAVAQGALRAFEEAEKVVVLRPERGYPGPSGRLPTSPLSLREQARIVGPRWSAGLAGRGRVVLAAVAVAALALLWSSWRSSGGKLAPSAGKNLSTTSASVPPPVAGSVELTLSSQDVKVGGGREVVGARVLGVGSLVEVGEGRACVSLDSGSDLCLGPHSRVKLPDASDGAPKLEKGHAFVVARSAPAGSSSPLILRVGKLLIHSVRSAYVLSQESTGATRLRVHEGQVTVKLAHSERKVSGGRSLVIRSLVIVEETAMTQLQLAADGQFMAARNLWRADGKPSPQLGRILVESEPEGANVTIDGAFVGRTPLGVLSRVGAHRVEVVDEGGAAAEAREISLAAGGEALVSFALADEEGAGAALHATRAPKSPTELGTLLSQARSAMKGGDWAGAAHAYRQIRTHYPTRPESRTILITLGQLELDRLGQPGQALTTFQTYLREDGALSREARLGQIRALARLGRAPEETSAIEAYLTSYPRSTEASRLRTRLRALSTQ